MIASTFFIAVSALSGLAAAQNYSTSGNLTVDASQVTPALRNTWCNAQRVSCPELCASHGGVASGSNTCDPTTLIWDCTCQNNPQPNISDYSQTAPSYICGQWIANCADNHPNDLEGLAGCHSVVCGSMNATEAEANATSSTSSSASMTATSSAMSSASETASVTASGSAASASATTTGAAMALSAAQTYGTTIIGTALLAIFGLAL